MDIGDLDPGARDLGGIKPSEQREAARAEGREGRIFERRGQLIDRVVGECGWSR